MGRNGSKVFGCLRLAGKSAGNGRKYFLAVGEKVAMTACKLLLAILLVGYCATATGQAAVSASQRQLVISTREQVTELNARFKQILVTTPREKRLQEMCNVDCTAVVDAKSGATVSQELDQINAADLAVLNRTEAAIRHCIRRYVEKSVRGDDFKGSRAAMMQGLKTILPGDLGKPPLSFVLNSPSGRSLIVFYAFGTGVMAGTYASGTVLDAFHVDAKGLSFVDSTGSDMNGYVGIKVKELPSPVKGQFWLLLSGQLAGANGPNTRMRIYAFDGKHFKTRWMPANIWGDFDTRVTDRGFVVTGTYYYGARKRPNEPATRDDTYVVTPDGVYPRH